MPRKLKVYGISSIRRECPKEENRHQQVRNIVAAPSMKEASRLLGMPYNHMRTMASETGNEEELALALSKPGTIFWKPLDYRHEDKWREVPCSK